MASKKKNPKKQARSPSPEIEGSNNVLEDSEENQMAPKFDLFEKMPSKLNRQEKGPPREVQKRRQQPMSLPSMFKAQQDVRDLQMEYQSNEKPSFPQQQIQQVVKLPPPPVAFPVAPLRPIATIENVSEIFQTKIHSTSIPEFKNYFSDHVRNLGTLVCEGNDLITDSHFYELTTMEMPVLSKIRIRACSNLTAFNNIYLQKLVENQSGRNIEKVIELTDDPLTPLKTLTKLIDKTIPHLEEPFGPISKESITKALIYHAYLDDNSLLPSAKMLLNQYQKKSNPSPSLIEFHKASVPGGYVALLECTHPTIFSQLIHCFHPKIIYLFVKNADDVLKWIFTLNSTASYLILNEKEIRLIIESTKSEDQMMTKIRSQLTQMSTSAEQLYQTYLAEPPTTDNENDDFRRNHYLSSLLHLKDKCEMLKKQLKSGSCLFWNSQEPTSFFTNVTKDAMQHSTTVYKLSQILNELEKDHRIFETEIPMMKLAEKILTITQKQTDEFLSQAEAKVAQIYYSHRLISDGVLHLTSESNRKSYCVSDIDLFCRVLNEIFTGDFLHVHRKKQSLIEQVKLRVGAEVHLVSKRGLNKLNLHPRETDFFFWVFNTWNIGYPISFSDSSDKEVYALFNSILTKPPVPLESVWPATWPTNDHQSVYHFRFLTPCDSSILFSIYKLLPCHKILLACKDFFIIQDGAIEVLLQFKHEAGPSSELMLACRSIHLLQRPENLDPVTQLINESFNYIVRHYFVVIWAFLFKHDYVFEIQKANETGTAKSFDVINGNLWMNHQWKDLPLYHYHAAPVQTSPCSICGLRSSVNKALYDACVILCPARHTTHKSLFSPMETNAVEDQSNSFLFEHGKGPLLYTGKQCLRPDGYNSFELLVLSREKDEAEHPGRILSSLRIGCLVNNFNIEPDEKIFFDYGPHRTNQSRNFRSQVSKEVVGNSSYLDEIRNFGGVNGLKLKKNKSQEQKGAQELYPGLRLRIDIDFTSKPNTFQLTLSVNGIPWSYQTIRRKSVRTMFQPIVSSARTDDLKKSVYLMVHHFRSSLDTALIEPSLITTNTKPWKVGMRLEAKDRKNPNICAIANIIEVYNDNRIRINFDGWTSNFDYTVEIDHPDIHPCGYWEYIQRVLYKNVNTNQIATHLTFNRYDKPKGYDRAFSWRNYLTEINEEPIPLECFNYSQTEGMSPEFFPHTFTKEAFTNLSCRHHYNVRVKYHKMNTFIQDELVSRLLFDHTIRNIPASSKLSPGAVLLPTPIDASVLKYPCLAHFQTNDAIAFQLTCNHRDVVPWDRNVILSGGHLLDTEGNNMSKVNLTIPAITLFMLTAVDLSRNQKHPIAPCFSKLIKNLSKSFDKPLIDFYIRRWLEQSAYISCFHSTDFYVQRLSLQVPNAARSTFYNTYSDADLFITLKKNLNGINLNYQVTTDMPPEMIFGFYGHCYYCAFLHKNNAMSRPNQTLEARFSLIGDYAPSIFYLEVGEQERQIPGNQLVLDDAFFKQFTGLEIIDVKNFPISRFELEPKNFKYLKSLRYLSLENNDLTRMDADFRHLHKLNHIRLIRNPLVSLPLNCFQSKSIQIVEMQELGRLTEIDPNARFSSELNTFIIKEGILTTLPAALGPDARLKLTKLTLSGASWWRPDGMSVNEVVKFESFEKRFISFLDTQDLRSIYHMYDEDLNGILSFSEINEMNAHIYRYIPRIRPIGGRLPNSGRSSTEPSSNIEPEPFKQDSFSIDPSGFPVTIFALENLTELTLDYQGIKVVPDGIKTLKSLAIFNLNYCIELETISAEVGFLPLKELNLTGCMSLKTPPPEIIRRGHTQTMAFLQRLISGSTACKRTKLMLVGLGGAGKTSLVRAFLRSHSSEPPTVTDGIDIIKWKVPLPQTNDALEFSVWDFAGQSVYYHTHQFFLAKKAVYVLAWNIRLGAEHAGLDFWLSSICCHAPNAPIFVVGTHMDQVSRIDLRQDDFKRRYPQIAGFFNVSTRNGENVNDLIENIIKTTLALPYMDEQIPRAWLTFENLIGKCQQDILKYQDIEGIAHNAGIFDPSEVLQSVQFLHDLGSLQYFSSEHLKNYVVINPQWIVNVMACIVSIKDSPVKDGRLHYDDISVIWENYTSQLHPWILKLTEAFDLTFPVPDQNMNLVPCLLPEEEPLNAWSDLTESELKELKIVYTFNYLPAGLFNRAQVRLFQFSDKSTIWRYGSLLLKNNHRAIIVRTDDRHIVIKIQGIRPDNILFLIHEVFENLVNESFYGVTYDIAFPCPDCLESRTTEPWQFSSSLINRAIELKSPSIQCHRFFHVASVTDLQALIPPDSKSNYDLHLEYSVRDLKSYRQNVAVDIAYLYPHEHIPDTMQVETKVDPRRIKDDLIKRSFKVWTPESMKDFKIENHYLVIKAAGIVLFGISTELVENPENQNLRDAFRTIKDIIRRPIIPILFGNNAKWKETEIGVALTDALYVNMQNVKRYETRIQELTDLIEQSRGGDKQAQQLRDQPTDVFISYSWSNSHDAVSKGTKTNPEALGWGDPRVLKDYLESRQLKVWMDITRLGKAGVIQDIVHGLKNTKVMVACVSNEYTKSEICRSEFLFAKNTLRLPVILAIFGSGDEWRMTEVGMCGLTCPQVNFQFENPSAFEDAFTCIESRLPKRPTSARKDVPDVVSKPGTSEKTTAAYQELFELTQRKFLRLTTGFADAMNTRPYPRLFTVDLMTAQTKTAQELARLEVAATQTQGSSESKKEDERDLEAEKKRDEEVLKKQQERKNEYDEEQVKKLLELKRKRLRIRALCEHEENWHPAGSPFEITEDSTLEKSAPYLTRILLLMKQSDLEMEILNTTQGEKEQQKLNEMAQQSSLQVKESYAYLRRYVMDSDLEDKYCDLKQCLMPSGKILWLCPEHQKQPRVVLVTSSVGGGFSRPQVEEKSEILKALNKLNEKISKNEIPPPELRVPQLTELHRPSNEKQTQNASRKSVLPNITESRTKPTDEDLQDDERVVTPTADPGAQKSTAELTTNEENEMDSVDCSIM